MVTLVGQQDETKKELVYAYNVSQDFSSGEMFVLWEL